MEVFLENGFLNVKLGTTEVFNASALVSVVPDSVGEPFQTRLVEVEAEVDVVTATAVDVLEASGVLTVHGPFVCLPLCECQCEGQW